MATAIKMPQLSDTMSSGKILVWHKKEGEQVQRGDILAEVETDKANLEIECFHSGVLLQITTPAEQVANVGETIAFVGQAGESISNEAKTPSVTKTAIIEAEVTPTVNKHESVNLTDNSDRIKVSPLAKKIAETKSIDLSQVSGTGPNGRIVKKDLESITNVNSNKITQTNKTVEISVQRELKASSPQSSGLSKMRATIAKRMQESMVESPHFYVTSSINMTEAVKLRSLLKPREDFKGISINHLVIKAAAYGLANEPRLNLAMRNSEVYNPGEINIGIITAIEDGLLIPVLKQADQMSLKDLVFEARAAIERARAGRPTSADLTGGTFSISNMGMFDVENFTAIINPGQGAILAVSAMKETPVVEEGKIVIAPVMKVTVSADHRIIDGIISATFLKHFKKALENPALLLV